MAQTLNTERRTIRWQRASDTVERCHCVRWWITASQSNDPGIHTSENPSQWQKCKSLQMSLSEFSAKSAAFDLSTQSQEAHIPTGAGMTSAFLYFVKVPHLMTPSDHRCALSNLLEREGSRWDQLLNLIVYQRSLTSMWHIHYSHKLLAIIFFFFQEWPTNAQSKKLSLLCGEVNESHYPPVISFIEFKPIMKEGIKAIRGFFFQLSDRAEITMREILLIYKWPVFIYVQSL